MNTVGNNGYTVFKDSLTNQQINKIRKDLTVKPFVNASFGVEAVPFAVYMESKRKLYLPRYYGISEFGYPDGFKINKGEEINVEFKGTLKDKQLPIVNAFTEAIKDKYIGGGIISVPCGYGKTVLGLYFASILKLKTLVIVHKEFLMNQWKERIEQFIPNARVGRIQRKKIITEDCDIVIGLLQSISMIEYPEETFRGFGFVIYDECHHLGAEVFSRALLKTNTRYTLGLSATPKRQDGLSSVFEWYLGPKVYVVNKRESETVKVELYHYQDDNPTYSKLMLNMRGQPNLPIMINKICEYLPRIKLIINLVSKYLEEGRKILLLSDRKNHLGLIKESLDSKHALTGKSFTTGYYLGGMKQEDLEKTEKNNVILGTFSMASEGFDCREPLDTIILASPKSSIEQAVGRILRQEAKDRKFVPLVIDIIDEFGTFPRQGLKRVQFYKRNQYSIDTFDKNMLPIKNKFVKSKAKQEPDLEFLPDSD
jgi:superfamily II DNA or RNA helicase